MKESKIVFGRWESVFMLVNLMSTQIILGFPRNMMETAGNAGWMIPIYLMTVALVIFYIIERLYRGFEGQDILEVAKKAGGNTFKIIIGLIFAIYIFSIISLILREFAEDIKVVALPVSPISFVTSFFIIGMAAGAFAGYEALVRLSSIFVPLIIFGLIIITVGVAPYYNFENIFPIFGTGLGDIFGKGILKLSIFSPMSILYFIVPFLVSHENFKKVGYAAILIAGILFFWGAFAFNLVFPYPTGMETFIPVYNLARLINLGRFFQRVESVFVLIWAASALVYLSAAFLTMLTALQRAFMLEYYKPLIWPCSILIFVVSLMPPNVLVTVNIENKYLRNYLWAIVFLLPIIILIIARAKRKRKVAAV